jgi:four helix bundle protein
MEVHFKFEDLNVYQKALNYIKFVYKITHNFPNNEVYALTSQFQRAAQSIALNIAEGSSGTKAQFIRFLKISQGSLYECVVCTTIAFNEKYIDTKTENESRIALMEMSKMLSGLIASFNLSVTKN